MKRNKFNVYLKIYYLIKLDLHHQTPCFKELLQTSVTAEYSSILSVSVFSEKSWRSSVI